MAILSLLFSQADTAARFQSLPQGSRGNFAIPGRKHLLADFLQSTASRPDRSAGIDQVEDLIHPAVEIETGRSVISAAAVSLCTENGPRGWKRAISGFDPNRTSAGLPVYLFDKYDAATKLGDSMRSPASVGIAIALLALSHLVFAKHLLRGGGC
jgi:hypothetical protein